MALEWRRRVIPKMNNFFCDACHNVNFSKHRQKERMHVQSTTLHQNLPQLRAVSNMLRIYQVFWVVFFWVFWTFLLGFFASLECLRSGSHWHGNLQIASNLPCWPNCEHISNKSFSSFKKNPNAFQLFRSLPQKYFCWSLFLLSTASLALLVEVEAKYRTLKTSLRPRLRTILQFWIGVWVKKEDDIVD